MRMHFIWMLLAIMVAGCHLKEDIYIDEKGSGHIRAECIRDESAHLQFAAEDYVQDEEYLDSTFLFKEIIQKEKETFSRFSKGDQDLLEKYGDVKINIKKDSYSKEYRTTVFQSFQKLDDVQDLSNILDYLNDLQYNYPMNPESKRTLLSYSFDGKVFKRNFKILNQASHDEYKETFQSARSMINMYNFSYTGTYHFPRKIKSFSNPDAVLSADGKMLTLKQSLLDCLEKPERGVLVVELEDKF